MATLFTKQPMPLQIAFSELKRRALEQPFLLVGTPGSVLVRSTSGGRFLYRDHYGSEGKKAADYIGPEGNERSEARANEVREQIQLANALIGESRLLVQSGYARVDARTDAVLAALANNGVFRGGGMVIGSHAYGALLNEFGARAAPIATEDVDIARNRRLDLGGDGKSFEEMLLESRVPLHPIPQLGRKKPSTSFKLKGRSEAFRVDLLVPTDGKDVTILEVRELNAHATALPWLRYLLHEPLPTVLIGRNTMVPVSVPQPERFACHKMLVSELRHETSEKRRKDHEQAATLVAVLAETAPESLQRAFRTLRRSARAKLTRGARRVLARLEETQHEQAVDLMKELLIHA